jgi:hypothetical protein
MVCFSIIKIKSHYPFIGGDIVVSPPSKGVEDLEGIQKWGEALLLHQSQEGLCEDEDNGRHEEEDIEKDQSEAKLVKLVSTLSRAYASRHGNEVSSNALAEDPSAMEDVAEEHEIDILKLAVEDVRKAMFQYFVAPVVARRAAEVYSFF